MYNSAQQSKENMCFIREYVLISKLNLLFQSLKQLLSNWKKMTVNDKNVFIY